MEGSRFGRFTVLAPLGAGGMGRVYRAHDPTLRRDVCIKVLRDDPAAARDKLLAEARSASALNHPNICTVYDIGDVDGTPFIAMELVEGRPLVELIPAGGLPLETAIRFGLQIAGALAHAHQHGVVHGDLKGQNVLVTSANVVKLVDFGLARMLEPASLDSLTRSQQPGMTGPATSGTVPFMAPETLQGAPLSPAADVWAFGVLLQEMITGIRPFTGATVYDLVATIISGTPRALPGSVPAAVVTVIGRCLQKHPADRYANAREPFVALELLLSGPHDVRTPWQSSSMPETSSAPASPAALTRSSRRVRPVHALIAAAVVAVVAAGFVWRWPGLLTTPSPGRADPLASLIVLPFDNLSGNTEEDYFANGMTEALITDLSRIPALKVISRTSAMRYKALGKSSREIARELGVGAIVDGAVLRSAGQVRIDVRLVDPSTDTNLWVQQYTGDVKGVLELQGAVARAIAAEIRASFVPADEERLKNPPPVSSEAHEEFLKGRHHWNRRTADGLAQALIHFRRATELQPDYAPAHAGLAQSYVLQPAFPMGAVPPAHAFPRAQHAAERAIALDDRLSDAHAALGYVRLHAQQFEAAEASFRRAIDVNPSDATARFWYAAALGARGRFTESIEQARHATTLDPVSPIITSGVAWMYHLARQFDLEVELAQAALALEPNFMMARYRLGEGYLHQGRYDEAIAELTQAHVLSGDNPDLLAALVYTYGRAGRRRDAELALRTLTELAASGTRYVSPYGLALAHAGLGNRDEALVWLGRAIDEGAWGTAFLEVEPDFDPLRSDPRFTSLTARMRK